MKYKMLNGTQYVKSLDGYAWKYQKKFDDNAIRNLCIYISEQ